MFPSIVHSQCLCNPDFTQDILHMAVLFVNVPQLKLVVIHPLLGERVVHAAISPHLYIVAHMNTSAVLAATLTAAL